VILLTQPEKNVIFMRKTDEDVVEIIRLVRRILEHPVSRRIGQALWGRPLTILRGDQHSLTTSVYAPMRGAQQLHGLGVGGSLTGKHADVIFTDDIVNLSDRLSAAEREHTRLIYQELQAIRNPGGRLVNTGTPWHPADAIGLMPRIHRFSWEHTPILDHRSVQALRQGMEPSLFAANYELRHIAPEDALLKTPPRFFREPERLRGGLMHIDASYGGRDSTALTILREDGGELLALGKMWKGSIHDALPEILELFRAWGCQSVHIETNPDKGWAAQRLRQAGLPVRAYHETLNKHHKIASALMQNWPRLRFLDATDEGYLRQVTEYAEGAAHDDAPDSLASALRRAARGRGIRNS